MTTEEELILLWESSPSKYTNTEIDISINAKSIEDEDEDLVVPQYISRNAFYSATGFILPNCIVAYILDYQFEFVIFAMLYTSTMIHWNRVKRNGPIRTIDMILAHTSLHRFTFIDRFRLCPIYQTYWLYIVYTLIIAYILNEYIFYMKVTRGGPYSKKSSCKYKVYTQWPLQCLNYTQPNTKERETAYYISTYVHMFFFHVLPMVTSGSFAILSHYQCPTK